MSEDKTKISKLKFLKVDEGSAESGYDNNSLTVLNEPEKSDLDITQDSASEKSEPLTKKFSNDSSSNIASQNKLPNFLQGISQSRNNLPRSSSDEVLNSPTVNSFSSIFNDKSESGGIKRVIRKSVGFLSAALISFIFLNFFALNVFSASSLFILLSIVVYVGINNLFFIVVADPSYVWLYLVGQFLVIIIANSFLGLGFSFITLSIALIVVLFTYLAYSDLEKIQLSSRLFSISHVTSEASRTISMGVIILVSLGVFNGIVAEGNRVSKNAGSRPFLERVFFENDFIVENIFIGFSKEFNLNKYLMDRNRTFYLNADDQIVYDTTTPGGTRSSKQATFRNYLFANYKESSVVGSNELIDIELGKCNNLSEAKCQELIDEEVDSRLEEWRKEAYGDLDLTLDSNLNLDNFKDITKYYYLSILKDFESTDNSNSPIPDFLQVLDTKSIIPAIFAVSIFLFLLLIKFIINWFAFIFTWIVWQILLATGFAHIDIETVEAEIVSI